MKKVIALSFNDLRNTIREPMLMVIMIGPLLMSFAMRFIIPFVTGLLYKEFGFDLQPYYPLIVGYVLLFVPMLMGMVIGFLLLDERDEHVLTTLIVTPLSKEGYIIYRIFFPIVISFIYGLLVIPIINLTNIPYILVIPVSALASMSAPIVALFLFLFAGNKVEGLALSKGLGLFMVAPLIGYFIKSSWRFIAGVIPFYWPVLSVTGAVDNINLYWLHIMAGIVVNSLVLRIFLVRFKKRIS